MGNGQSFLNNLEWRRAVKHFGGGELDISGIINAIVNAPSSFGLQPYKIIVVKDKKILEELRKVSFDQPQVSECSALLVFCARSDIQKRVDEYVLANDAEELRPMMEGFLKNVKEQVAWAEKQAYIALGFALAAAAEQKIASCPMEGFMPLEVKKILDLPDNLYPSVYLALGEQVEEENQKPRFRFPISDLVSGDFSYGIPAESIEDSPKGGQSPPFEPPQGGQAPL